MKAFFQEFFLTIILAAVMCVGFKISLQTFIVLMDSMEPSFHEGQRLLVNKAAYFFSEPQRGDVIIFHAPPGSDGDFIKRIIAVPGDTVAIQQGTVYVNGVPLDEPYLMSPPQYTVAPQEVPANSYFVLGDNRNISYDSHNNYLVPREDIVGKAWLSMWPPADWGVVPDYQLEEQLSGT